MRSINLSVTNCELCLRPMVSASLVDLAATLSPRTYGVVVIMFDIHRNDRGSNPGRGDDFS